MAALLFHGLGRRESETERGDMTLMRERSESGGGGPESIWFGASRASFLACSIPEDQRHGVSFQPPSTHSPP